MRRFFPLAVAAATCAAGAAHAAPVPLATEMPGVVSFAGPPPGFDAVHASDADLQTYGFPPRPGPLAGAQARSGWEQMISHARIRIAPRLALAPRSVGGPLRARNITRKGASTSTNWSGFTLTSGVNSYTLGSFDLAVAAFNVPIAQQAFGTCSGGWEYSALWVGLDGVTTNSVMQAGTEADAYCSGGYTQADYYAWVEWYPANGIKVTNLAVTAGDVVAVWINPFFSTTNGMAFIINETTNNYVTIGFSAPAGTSLIGSSVEWIMERPANQNGSLTSLMNYAVSYMSNMYGQQVFGSTFVAMSPPPFTTLSNTTMTDTLGNTLSTANPLGNNAVQFQDAGSAN